MADRVKRLTIKLDADLHRRFKAFCAAQGVDMQDVSVSLIQQFVDGKRQETIDLLKLQQDNSIIL